MRMEQHGMTFEEIKKDAMLALGMVTENQSVMIYITEKDNPDQYTGININISDAIKFEIISNEGARMLQKLAESDDDDDDDE